MSINVLKAHEPRLDIEANRVYVCMQGGSSTTISPQSATNVSGSQIQWTVTTPSTRTGVDRRLDKDCTFFLDYSDNANPGTAFSDPILVPSLSCGPRQYPVASVTQVENIRLNDQLFGWEPSELVIPLQQYGNEVEDRQYYCAAPHMPDTYVTYDVGAANAGPRNPYANYFQNVIEDSRSVQFTVTRENNPNPGVVNPANKRLRIRVREPIFQATFYYGRGDYQALFGIQKVDVNLTLLSSSNLNRFFGGRFVTLLPVGAPGANEANFTLSVSQAVADHKLWFNYITPQPHMEVPSRLVYPYYQVNKFTQNFSFAPTGAGGNPGNLAIAPVTVTYNNITLHEIPKRVYHFARQNINAANSYILPDFYPTINFMTVNFDNVDGRLSNSDTLALWKIAVKNGLKRSFIEFSNTIGAVQCLEMGTDLTLSPLLSQGVRGNFQYQASINYAITPALLSYLNSTVPNASTAPYDFANYVAYTITIPDGVLMVDNQLVTISVGGITEEMLAMAPFAGSGFRQQIRNMYGGAWYNSVWKGLKKAWHVVAPVAKKIANVAATVLPHLPVPYANEISTGARVVGDTLGALGAGRRKPGRPRKHGGRRMGSHSLSRRL